MKLTSAIGTSRHCHASAIVVDSVDPDALRRRHKPPNWGTQAPDAIPVRAARVTAARDPIYTLPRRQQRFSRRVVEDVR